MSMQGRNPFEELERIFDRMSRQFEGSWGEWEMPGGMQEMSIDVADRADEIVVTADLPGFERDDIDVRLADNRLRIHAHREETTEETGEEGRGEYIRQERSHRSMNRSITLPESVDEENVHARYTNGVLTVTLPKLHKVEESRSISIE